LDEAGEVLLEQRLSTTPKAMKEVFGRNASSRMALETEMHSSWVSRVLSELGREVIAAHGLEDSKRDAVHGKFDSPARSQGVQTRYYDSNPTVSAT
jgi:hypothetical protein